MLVIQETLTTHDGRAAESWFKAAKTSSQESPRRKPLSPLPPSILSKTYLVDIQVAEKLYQQGFLSYPRTETDQFDPQFDHKYLIHKQTVDSAWGNFATSSVPPPGESNNITRG